MRTRTPNANEQVLLDFLGVSQDSVKKWSETVYTWRGKYLEILTVEQMKRGKVPASWYTPLGEYRFREMGKQAEKVRKIRSRI